jgi:hypothetical protein
MTAVGAEDSEVTMNRPEWTSSAGWHRLLARAASGLILMALIGGAGGAAAQRPARVGEPAPEINGSPWIGSEPLTLARLRGRVVLVEFWTYG